MCAVLVPGSASLIADHSDALVCTFTRMWSTLWKIPDNFSNLQALFEFQLKFSTHFLHYNYANVCMRIIIILYYIYI